MHTVHFYGDSFVAGFGDPTGLGWVGRIATLAKDEGTPFRAVNHGVPGATSVAIAEQWLRATDDPRNRGLPDTKVVFSFGTNDAVLGAPAQQPLESLRSVLDRAEEIGVPAFVVGPPPIGDMPEQDALLAETSRKFAITCTHRSVPFIETHEHLRGDSVWSGEAAAADGSHPQADGYAELAELLCTHGLQHWLAR